MTIKRYRMTWEGPDNSTVIDVGHSFKMRYARDITLEELPEEVKEDPIEVVADWLFMMECKAHGLTPDGRNKDVWDPMAKALLAAGCDYRRLK